MSNARPCQPPPESEPGALAHLTLGCDRNSKKADTKPAAGAGGAAETCIGQPYSPVLAGACTPFEGQPRTARVDLPGLKGHYCAPACTGFAKACPAAAGTSAEGMCFFNGGDNGQCAAWCRVDAPPGSAQCPCGATCQPYGANDGDGNQRGICLFK